MAFNRGKGYHGSSTVEGGKLRGRTGQTDYFFFICPKCPGEQVMRVLEYTLRDSPTVERPEKKRPTEHFNMALHLYCPNCQHEDFIKIDNNHQAGSLTALPRAG
jgi:hypothetical protein